MAPRGRSISRGRVEGGGGGGGAPAHRASSNRHRAVRADRELVEQVIRAIEAKEGWLSSQGGRAGKGRRSGGGGGRGPPADGRGAAVRERRPRLAEVGDRKDPEWLCTLCGESNWRTRAACRFCKASRAGLARTEAATAAAARLHSGAGTGPATHRCPAPPAHACPATGTNTTPLGTRPPTEGALPPKQAEGGPTAPRGEEAAAQVAAKDAAAPSPAAVRKHQAAVREQAAGKLTALDAAIAALDESDEEALRVLRAARKDAAEQLASTRPLGQRLMAARRLHEKATSHLRAAEAAAVAANAMAVAALEAEHEAASALANLEQQVALQEPPQAPQPLVTPAGALLAGMDNWLRQAGLAPPPEVTAAALLLKAALNCMPTTESPTVECSPTEPASPAADADLESDVELPAAAAGATILALGSGARSRSAECEPEAPPATRIKT